MPLINLLDKSQLPEFFKNLIQATAETIDKLDLFEKDGWLSSIPFGKLAGFAAKKFIEIGSPEKALNKAVGLACSKVMIDALLKYQKQPKIESEKFNEFQTTYKELINSDKINPAAFELTNFWDCEIVNAFYEPIYQLVANTDLDSLSINKVTNYIKEYSKIEFIKIIEKNPTVFEKLTTFLSSDSYEALSQQYKLESYRLELTNNYNDVVLNNENGITLSDIYIEPNFRIYEKCLEKNDYEVLGNEVFIPMDSIGFKEDIHQFMNSLVLENKLILRIKNPSPRIIFLYGYPGQGKTSFCYRLLNDISTKLVIGQSVHFVRLRRIADPNALKNKPIQTILDYINEEYEIKLAKRELIRSLLILDGLDELFMRSNLQHSDIEEICKELIEIVNRNAELKIVVTSRYGYVDLEKLPEHEVLIIQLDYFSLSQQFQWLEKMKKHDSNIVLTKEKLEEINSSDSYLKELINQPILLHMIATLEENVDHYSNRANIYEKLFNQLTNPRRWKTNQVPNLKGLKAEDLRAYLRELAFEIYKTGEGYIQKNAIIYLDATEKFRKKIHNSSLRNTLKPLMIAFYFREVEKRVPLEENDEFDYAIEFLHKSLMEYLVAEKIWYAILNEFLGKNREGDYYLEKKSRALQVIDEIFGSRRLSVEVVSYLIEIIANCQNINNYDLVELHQRLEGFLDYFLKKDFLYSYNSSNSNNPIQRALSNFYGYWIVFSHLPKPKNNLFLEKNKVMLVEILNRFNNSLSFVNLSNMDLGETRLIRRNLPGVNFKNSNLKKANLPASMFHNANFIDASLQGANLNMSSLTEANFEGANLSNSNFKNANFGKR